MIRSLPDLLKAAQRLSHPPVMACAAAHDPGVLSAVREAERLGLVTPLLVGDRARMAALCEDMSWRVPESALIDEPSPSASARRSVALCVSGEAQMLMKGALPTATMLKAVIGRRALRTGARMTHVTAFRPRGARRLVLMADAGVAIAPDEAARIDIVHLLAGLVQGLDLGQARVALLSAIETVNPKIASSAEAAAIARHFASLRATQEPAEAAPQVGGPYALDVAMSPAAAASKDIDDGIAGQANALVLPGIDAANVLYKSLAVLVATDLAAIVTGTRVPFVVPSRADSPRTRLFSIAFARLAHATLDRS